MSIKTMTTLLTGNKRIPVFNFFKRNRGVSFVEVMVAAAILSFGIVMLYRAFFVSLNYVNHITYRLYAMNILDNKISMLQKTFEVSKIIPFTAEQETETAIFDNRAVNFRYTMNVVGVDDLEDFYRVDISVSWVEHAHPVRLLRSFYLAS